MQTMRCVQTKGKEHTHGIVYSIELRDSMALIVKVNSTGKSTPDRSGARFLHQ